MADIMATIANIGLLKVVGAFLIVGLLVAAFIGSNNGKGDGKGPSGGGSNQ